MTRTQAWALYIANALAGGTGIVYGVMRYALRSDDPFAVVNHPWQPHAQHLHVLLSPALVLVLGLLLIAHGWPYWRAGAREGRWSGLLLGLTGLPMVFSGYLIQVTVSPSWRTAWITLHLLASALWVLALAAHALTHLHRRRV